MAAKTQITNRGLELMASSSKATGQHWWLGWYALAYVPDELQEEDGEKLRPAMTKLTTDGDIIYNIFQGDMNGDGYQTTKASSKFKSVNYDSNIKKNYRYVLDESGRNNLVTFVDGKHGLKGACVYQGVQVMPSRDDNEINHEKSTIPLPAPLLYTGVKAAGEGWSSNGMNIFLGSGTDSIKNFYPIDDGVTELDVPRVSADFRNYEGYKNGLTKIDDGEQGYDDALDTDTFEGVDFDGWFPAVNTYTQNGETDMDEPYNQYCRQYWKVLSISNFNKYCAPVNASGLLYDENTGCRNMAKATKYFPISDYSVTSTAKTADNEYATGIKLKVQLKLNGNAEDGAYFKEVETGTEGNVAALNPNPTPEEQELFNSQKVSFKFNRIGIYAVPMRQYGCSDDSSEMKAQYQIDTEAEPVLFAVCEWDSPVTLSDSGDGLSEFQSDIFIDLSAAVEDSSVIRESAVFYNLYEDDAIDWYKNQLVANASMAEALVNMQIEMGYIRNQKNAKAGCCPKEEAIQQKEKSVTGLRNLVDAKDYNSNSVRNRLAQVEGTSVKSEWSDVVPKLGGIGYPHTSESYNAHIYARKSTVNTSALYASYCSGASYEDAGFDGNTYVNLAINRIADGANDAVQIGGRFVRTQLYYELFSLQPSQTRPNLFAYDYDDNLETNDFTRVSGEVTDYFGTGTSSRDFTNSAPHITITMTPGENNTMKIETRDGDTVTQDYPSALNSRPEFVAETNRLIAPYETKRVYTVYYTQDTNPRDYSSYTIKRTTSLSLPKTQIYRMDTDVYSTINQHLASSGWRIPTKDDWKAIIEYSTPEKIQKIRSNTKWGMTGGNGGVYPLGGGCSTDTTTSVYIPEGDPVIYLAIANDDNQVVKFNGREFEIIDVPTLSGAAGFTHVSILCVTDATKVTDGTSNYKLGYDSYALMEGSVTEGSHNFNAGENSSIFASANYNSIFGGMYNKISNSAHNAILNGYHNELTNAVFSVVFGENNLVKQGSSYPCCRMLAAAKNSVISQAVTSEVFAEDSDVNNVFASSIFISRPNTTDYEKPEVQNVCCSRFIGQVTSNSNNMQFSDVIAFTTYHLPFMFMTRAALAYDTPSVMPPSLVLATTISANYAELIGQNIYFLDKQGVKDSSSVNYSRLVGGNSVGIISTTLNFSDIIAAYDGKNHDNWYNGKTLESINANYSSIRMAYSSITSHYIGGSSVAQTYMSFVDIAMSDTCITLSNKSGDQSITRTFSFGVFKLSHSVLTQCDCAYVYEMGTRHYLTSAQIHYATLFGNQISLYCNYIKNTHIYGSLHLSSSLDNHIILAGLDGTSVGSNSASSYISEFGSYITSNYKNYPMIWSMGGLGLFMNKIVLGDNGVASADKKAPSVGDVLSVVGVEDNMATVAWKSGGAAGSGGIGGKCVITDFDVFEGGIPSSIHSSIFSGLNTTLNAAHTRILHSGATGFATIVDDTAGPISGNGWTYGDVGKSWYNEFPWFRFKPNESVLDIYTWYAYKGLEIDGSLHKTKWYVNNKWSGGSGSYNFIIMGNELQEGIVYEVRIHIVSLPPSDTHYWSNGAAGSDASFNDWASPVSEKVSPGTKDSISLGAEMSFEILFTGSVTGTCATWGAPDGSTTSTNPQIIPSFRLPAAVTDNNNGSTYSSRTEGRIFDIIAEANVQFVRLGNKVYLMSY